VKPKNNASGKAPRTIKGGKEVVIEIGAHQRQRLSCARRSGHGRSVEESRATLSLMKASR
jgi:hypothetical protein